jgi:transposase
LAVGWSRSADHSTLSKNHHGRFRESDLLRKLFETVVARCMKERLVGGEAFAVDASMIVADAHRRCGQGQGSRSNVAPRGRGVSIGSR